MQLTRKQLIDSSLNKPAIWTTTVLVCVGIFFGFKINNLLLSITGWFFAIMFFEALVKLTCISTNIEKGNFTILKSFITDKQAPFELKIDDYTMNVSPNLFELFSKNEPIYLILVNDVPFGIYSSEEFNLDEDLKKFVK